MTKKKIELFIWNLGNRGGMYLLDESYHSLLSMIMGYFQAVKDNEGKDYSYDFHSWMGKRNGYRSSIHWGNFILKVMSDGDEKIAKKKLIELLNEYFSRHD